MKKISFFFAGIGVFTIPLVAFAADINSLLDMLLEVTMGIIKICGVLAFVAFFYGLVLFLFSNEDDKKKEQAKNIMAWGTLALFILVTIWGIIGFIQNTIGNTEGPQGIKIDVPQV
ncbi:MAG: hypothetical protein WC878_02460 [Candidatus Paceibacterota bacterium]|jgi:cbb3-type cytochrome oxidase subunit 3